MTNRVRFLATLLAASLAATACSSGGDVEQVSADEAPTTSAAPETTAAETAAAETTAAAPATTEAESVEDTVPETTAAPMGDGRDFSAIAPIIETYIADNELNGAGFIVVHRDDGVVYHDHWGEFSEDRVSLIASSSKMISAGVLLRLQDDGLLDIDAPVADVVEWGAANPEITPAQLISNSSGLVGLLPNPAYGPYICQYDFSQTLQDCGEAIFTTPDDDADIAEPDTEFRYGGAQWQVAGAVAEVAAGKSWADLIDEIYVQPCGLEALGFNSHFAQLQNNGFNYPGGFEEGPSALAATENPNPEGGGYVTTGDYGKLLLMHLRGGMCGDEQVLSQASLDLMHGDRIEAAYDGDAFGTGTGYGMGWWVNRADGRLNDGGAYGSIPWLDLEDGYGAFLVIEASNSLGNGLADLLYEPVEAAILSS